MKIVVAEKISASAVALLEEPRWTVITHDQLEGKLHSHLETADALIVRSAVQVNAALLEHAHKLRVVGRAGVGVDNVDLEAATRKGIAVMNTPGANAVAVAELTLGLMLAMARFVPRADALMHAGKWEKSKFLGSELAGKTLGVIGLGQVGSRVAARARAFEAKVVAFDPFLPAEKAKELGVPLLDLPELLSASDIVTLHATATDKGQPLIGKTELARMKKGAILVNVARGSLVDRKALAEALVSDHLAGAALDVFDPEPPDPADPLLKLPNVVTTPHLGASTVEAQERVALQTVEAVVEALSGASYVPAVNLPFRGPADPTGAAAWMSLAERTARFLSCLLTGRLTALSVETWGLPDDLLRPVAVAAVKGALEGHAPETVNFVNALHVAADRGVGVSETRHADAGNYSRSVRVTLGSGAEKFLADATLFSGRDARVVAVDGLPLEFRPEGTVVFLRNRDIPGVVGSVGTILGEGGVNIANFSLARGVGERAAAVIAVDSPPPAQTLERLRQAAAVEEVRVVTW